MKKFQKMEQLKEQVAKKVKVPKLPSIPKKSKKSKVSESAKGSKLSKASGDSTASKTLKLKIPGFLKDLKDKIKIPKIKKLERKNKPGRPTQTKKPAGAVGANTEIPFYRSIAVRLIGGFMVPILGVMILGVVSYKTASGAIVNTYKESVQQTMKTMEQYVDLVVKSEKDEFSTYLKDSVLERYLKGWMEPLEETRTRREYEKKIVSKRVLDDKIHSVYFLADSTRTILPEEGVDDRDLYTEYIQTEQGKMVDDSATEWFFFGQDSETDEIIGMENSNYSLRIAKKMNTQPSVMLVNISDETVRTTMSAVDPGEGGYVALVTGDGAEFYADTKSAPSDKLIYGTDFYKDAMEKEESAGNQMIRLNGREYLFVYNRLDVGNAMVAALIPSARLLEQSAEIKKLAVILTILCAVVAMVLGVLISRQMTGTIQYILRQLRKVAKGDLTVTLKGKKQDEFGMLCDGVNDTVDHVKSLIRDVNDVSGQVQIAAQHLAKTSGTFMETSRNIQDAVIEIEGGVNKLDTGSDNCLSQMDSLSGKITNVSSNADELGKLTNETGATINAGISSVQSLTKSSEITVDITRNVIESVQQLEQKSKQISTIVSAINAIAEQTNLLSLNASIEAARAGEAGRGFSVVAEEIRKLADQCLASSGQIANIVDDIVTGTGNVVNIAKEAEAAVSSQYSVVEDTTASFRQIDGLVARLIDALQIISNNVEEMNGARNETLSAIESISDASSQTAECSSSVHMAAGTQMEAVKNLEEASKSLTEKADSLLSALATFQV